ncbi:MAG: hypothetical protein Roseis2KO_44100 [Roseivirga sp.]
MLVFTNPAYSRQSGSDFSQIKDEAKVDTLLSLAFFLARDDFKTALQYSGESLELARALKYQKGEIEAFLTLSRIQIIRSKYDSVHLLLSTASRLIDKYENRSLKAKALNTYGWLAQREKEFDKSIDYLLQARNALEDGDLKEAASINVNLGITYYFMSEFDSARKYYKNGLSIATQLKDSLGMLNGYRNIGIVLRRKGNTREAIKLYYEALRIAENLQLASSIADVHNSIGVAFDHLKEYDKALEHYRQTLKIRRQLSDRKRLSNVLSNIGWVLSELEQYDKALEAHLESLEIAEEIGGHTAKQAAFNNIGLVYKQLKQYDLAYDYFQKSLKEYQSIDDKRGVALVVNNLASVHFNKREYPQAVSLLEDHLSLIEEFGDQRTVMIAYEHLYEYNEAQGLTEEALKYHKRYKLMADSIFNIERTAEVLELSEKYENEQKERELGYKDKQIKTLEELAELRKQVMIISSLGALVVFSLIFLLVRYRNLRNKKALLTENELVHARFTNERLEKEQAELKLKSKEKELLSFALNLTQKNDLLRRMKEVIEKKVKHKGALKTDFKELEGLIESNDQSEREWESFKNLFQELHHDFFNKLKARHPELTIYETRLCALIKLNLSSAEMAGMLNITISSLTSARYRLRKKLGLSGKDDLNQYIDAFNGIATG